MEGLHAAPDQCDQLQSGSAARPGHQVPDMIYTSYEMIQDSRAGKPAGWSYFLANYKPVAERLAAHYGLGDVEAILASVRESLLPSIQPMPERHFVAELRQK